ncbi:peptide MFS transporter [Coralloluteibacterium stylophorae]|uniref:Oligopeptide:H+ symporter n=2 Tax=Coralloluteibacterium stylophorae TaxID=1776034 RepID=A0AAP2CA91_9GAMM|nr:oligopeptide:H+ symporter [Coralloluteibacterium stylophorae]MBS7456694.1 oligopeptide:H+ symporter [Coralloluteibacterium stylophorae]
MTDLPAAPQRAVHDDFLGHPKGLFVCFFTELWERFSFYGMKALLFLYLTKYHLFGDAPSYDLLGAYGGLVYAVPVIGGLLADRFLGMRKAVVLGGVLLVLGHLGMAVEGEQARLVDGVVVRDDGALQVFYLSLALIIMGVGFLKPNISTIVGQLYPKNDPRRESGFTVFYAGINVGALFASLVCAFLGETYGWKYGFGAAGIGMGAGLVVFLWGQKYLRGLAEPPDPARLRERVGPLSREWLIYLGSFAGVLLVWQLIQRTWTVHGAMHVIAAAFAAWFVWFLARHCTRVQREQMVTLVVLIFGVLIFFALYEQTYGSWVAFTDRLLTKDLFRLDLGGYTAALPWAIFALGASPLLMVAALMAADRGRAGLARGAVVLMAIGLALALAHDVILVPQTAGSLTFIGAFFIVVLAPVFSWLWPWLERRGLNPSKPAKMAVGLVLAGLAFLPLMLAASDAAGGALASVWWLVLAYFVLELGEMCLSPIGLAAVTQLSVARVVGLMMGAFWLGTAYSEVLAAQFGKLAAIEIPEDGVIDMAQAAGTYGDLFQSMLWIGIGSGVLFLILTPLLRRWMHGEK